MHFFKFFTKMLLGANLLLVFNSVSATAERGNAKMLDSLAQTVCSSIKVFSKTNKVVGPLKTPDQLSEEGIQPKSHCEVCRVVRWKACNNCLKFSYAPCSNKEISGGKSYNSKKSGRIVNGVEVIPHEFPFLVRMSYGESMHLCGGSIYNKNWIITAGHCVAVNDILTDPEFTIVGGDHDRSKVEPTEQRVKIKSIVSHEDYNRQSMENDIALVQVSPPFELNSAVAPICLAPKRHELKLGEKVRPIGWGRISSNVTVAAETPKTVQIRVIGNDECRDLYVGFFNIPQEKVICALPFSSTRAGTCLGDSGGPLIIDRDGVPILVGLVSAGRVSDCASLKNPSVFTSITYFHDWIVAHAI